MAALTALALGVPRANGTFGGENGQLAAGIGFDRGDCAEVIDCTDRRLWLVNPRHGRFRAIETCSGTDCDDSDPAWLPDGARLAFVRSTDGDGEVLTVLPDGSGLQPLGGGGGHQAWAPDGSRLVYEQVAGHQPLSRSPFDLWISNRTGSRRRRLTREGGAEPDWSSRGRIAFARRHQGFTSLYTIRPDGTGLRRITRGRHLDHDPSWSPDGRLMVFTRAFRRRDGRGVDDLAVVPAGGGRVRRLTRAGGQLPVWSPDGDSIAFARGRRLMVLSLRTRVVRELLRVSRRRSLVALAWQPLPG